MAIIKCKMCGGDLVLVEGQSVAECEYCGSRQTVPAADNEKKLTLFARANRLRAACEFDKAAGIYESIVADFPEEAEAYWGLVLCKYGIEYVDDPATGRKIPTCHRSSFDSIMDDANFEQALENADAVARKVYREEAKQIEEIRKGIIAVSSNEQPYDIFICYKETDENGERTLDSVLAQDIYDTLVSRDYRTFFARITLEDKLGMEYEPYIFAALNSAKIMLAIGTDYEYYNAVWVKNEWSRYLKLMTHDKTKHLIPCFKGIDAYDMPKEFARLQAQDLGKVGAMQDLLRGIDKILPKKNTTVIQERVVVGGGGDNKIASLLDRGNMALEDGDWAKADSFFEDVLNNDSKNAQAYIGKTLAQEKCRTMDAFVRKRKGLYETVKGQKLALEPNTKHIEEVADQCRIPNYLTAEEIRNLYQFDVHYNSDVAERRQQYQKEESYWANHKLLSRAEKFAAGAVAENLQREKKALFAALSEQVKKAEAMEAGHKKSVQERYAQHIAQMDAKAAQLHREAVAQREQDYRNWVMKVKNTEDLETLRGAESFFANQGDYQKCPALAMHCQKRIADITAENERKAAEARAAAEAEAERKRIAKAKADAARKKKNKRITILSASAAVIVIAAIVIVTTVVIPGSHYKQAETLMDEGRYAEAIAAFEALGDYKDSAERIADCNTAVLDEEYDSAVAMMNDADYLEAIAVFEKLDGYRDSNEQIAACNTAILDHQYHAAVGLKDEGKFEEAIAAFTALAGYRDSLDQIELCTTAILDGQYDAAAALLDSGDVVHAAMEFGKLGSYRDAEQRSYELWEDIVDRPTIAAGGFHTVALHQNGTVLAQGGNSYGQCAVGGWNDIVSVAAGTNNTIGLRSDGTVVATGNNKYGELNISGWSNIVAISSGNNHVIGLRSDGTVVAAGQNEYGQTNVSDWTDIIAISAGYKHTVGLRSDGTVVAVGSNEYQESALSSWRNIVSISAGLCYTVGLCSDGTVVTSGSNANGQCDVGNWKGIKLPD